MQKVFFYILIVVLIKVSSIANSDMKVIGAIENVYIPSVDIVQKARIDTGATLTSIHAIATKYFEKDAQKWVTFTMEDSDKNLIEQTLPVVKIIHVKRGIEYKKQKRYVVKMCITLGDITKIVDVSLNNRTNMKYPILIGRNFLKGDAIVDVSQKFVTKIEEK